MKLTRRALLITLTISALTLFSCQINGPVSIHFYTDTEQEDVNGTMVIKPQNMSENQ